MAAELVKEITSANNAYVSSFSKGDLALPPARKFAVVACMDARLDPAKALGLEEGDAHVIRNAGGLVVDAIRSLVISEQLLGTQAIIILQHSDCGMLTFTNEQAHEKIEKVLGPEVRSIDFHPFPHLEESVKNNVNSLRSSVFIPKSIPIYGYVYDVKTGKVTLVAESEGSK